MAAAAAAQPTYAHRQRGGLPVLSLAATLFAGRYLCSQSVSGFAPAFHWRREKPNTVQRHAEHPGGPPLPSQPLGVAWPSQAGVGSVVVELFLDLCCPFSKKMIKTLASGVAAQYEGNVTFVFQSVVQPWHAQSSYMHEASLAVLDVGGPAAFWKFALAVLDSQEEFFDDKVYDKTRQQLYEQLANIAGSTGVDAEEVLAKLNLAGPGNAGNAVTQRLKWATKLHRVRGVHVTPTVYVNGLEAGVVGSGWAAEDWQKFLDWHIEQAH
eukprot:CAMPEP_0179179544 /NCGR_PEP_ID=MMETSP0796-20121207/88861_1 /TAXON_ID=73915 /ORGANISM="Pyrodinium bahamense, Strain pbaha01" /LENGTH=266 /DNA_ID=CAMNT_0020883211 /DNA_START=14 /DNA_END=814 /DNA_ORIENTATION=-